MSSGDGGQSIAVGRVEVRRYGDYSFGNGGVEHLVFNITEKLVSVIFVTWVNFIFCQLNEINLWPTKTVAQETMPSSFRRLFPTTRVITDATKIPIQKPCDVAAQSAAFSTYKNTSPLKVLVGCSL